MQGAYLRLQACDPLPVVLANAKNYLHFYPLIFLTKKPTKSMAILFIFIIAVVVLIGASMWTIFTKAGQPGWAAIIPIYNMIVLLKIVGKPTWWILLCLIPGVNYVFIIWTYNMLSKSFGKEEGFTVGLILLGIVFFPILAFGDAKYLGPFGDPVAFATAQQPHFDFDAPQPA
jgi:hypothetical protein